MGIPKFFRWMSEKYPGLLVTARENQIPEIDNFYLDMNGIIHNCSHPCDGDVHFRISEEQMFEDIFNYIDTLFKIIKPKEYMFMAVDGVAPRAKMNQQRGRRFRSAKEASDREEAAIKKGDVLPDEQRFDSNCITPGTRFMVKLDQELNKFIETKMSTDPSWQKVKVILSGHKTPGEGEHKVMDFIRYQRSQPDHDQDTRHCLYGLDTDLIMLGLSSHEPNFVLLREDIKFGGKKNEATKGKSQRVDPSKISFNILDLKLLREFIKEEYSPIERKMSFKFDLEAIIDDWILICFLVGNDFIPHIPHFHIHKNALPKIFGVYQFMLTKLDGYLNEKGILNLERFKIFAQALATVDFENYKLLLKENGGDCAKDNFSKLNEFVRHKMKVSGVKQQNTAGASYGKDRPNQVYHSNHSNYHRSNVWYDINRGPTNNNVNHKYSNHTHRAHNNNNPHNDGHQVRANGTNHTPRRSFHQTQKVANDPKPNNVVANGRVGVHSFTERQINESITVCADGDFVDVSDEEFFSDEKFPGDSRRGKPTRRSQNYLAKARSNSTPKNEKKPSRPKTDDQDYFRSYKKTYYREKLKIDGSPNSVMEIVNEYVRALQWNLHYYYHGCVSWGWFYPYHYAPFISDIANFTDVNTIFELGEPFKPFDQLLSVLPAASSSLLPQVYRCLVTSNSSPLSEYFPTEVEYDLNGKQNDWEAVVLAPFIDEQTLLKASILCNLFLSREEKFNNAHGPHMLYYYETKGSQAGSSGAGNNRRRNRPSGHGFVKQVPIAVDGFAVARNNIRYGLIKKIENPSHE